MCRDASDRERSSEKLPVTSDSCDRIIQSFENSDTLNHIHATEERNVEESVTDSIRVDGSTAGDAFNSNSNSMDINTESRLDNIFTLHSMNCASRATAGDSLISRPWRAEAALKLHDLPILRPPEGFRVPVFRCKTPSLSWQHCGCPTHTHLPPRRSSIIWSAFERCGMEPAYRTWPNRATRKFGRPSRRTVGTQSSLDGARSSLGVFRCVVRSIDMTERSLDQEIGASIPF